MVDRFALPEGPIGGMLREWSATQRFGTWLAAWLTDRADLHAVEEVYRNLWAHAPFSLEEAEKLRHLAPHGATTHIHLLLAGPGVPVRINAHDLSVDAALKEHIAHSGAALVCATDTGDYRVLIPASGFESFPLAAAPTTPSFYTVGQCSLNLNEELKKSAGLITASRTATATHGSAEELVDGIYRNYDLTYWPDTMDTAAGHLMERCDYISAIIEAARWGVDTARGVNSSWDENLFPLIRTLADARVAALDKISAEWAAHSTAHYRQHH